MNTPNNPTGSCLSCDDLIEIGNIAQENDLIIIADEIYTLLSYDRDFVPINTLEQFFERAITLRSFPKDFVMTGWLLGYVIAPSPLITTIKDINENNVFTEPSISQRAGLHALRSREVIQQTIVDTFIKRDHDCL